MSFCVIFYNLRKGRLVCYFKKGKKEKLIFIFNFFFMEEPVYLKNVGFFFSSKYIGNLLIMYVF